MLSRRFSAHEALIVAEKATAILDQIDGLIEESVLNGHKETHILIFDHNKIPNGEHTEIGAVFIQARDFFIEHYMRRRFNVEYKSPFLTISCPKNN